MGRIHNTVRRGDINIAAGGLVGVLMFVLIISLIKLAVFVLIAGVVLWVAFRIVQAILTAPKPPAAPPAPYRVEDDAAAQAHRARMRATLGYDVYTR